MYTFSLKETNFSLKFISFYSLLWGQFKIGLAILNHYVKKIFPLFDDFQLDVNESLITNQLKLNWTANKTQLKSIFILNAIILYSIICKNVSCYYSNKKRYNN